MPCKATSLSILLSKLSPVSAGQRPHPRTPLPQRNRHHLRPLAPAPAFARSAATPGFRASGVDCRLVSGLRKHERFRGGFQTSLGYHARGVLRPGNLDRPRSASEPAGPRLKSRSNSRKWPPEAQIGRLSPDTGYQDEGDSSILVFRMSSRMRRRHLSQKDRRCLNATCRP
jgi:hypothetical protein